MAYVNLRQGERRAGHHASGRVSPGAARFWHSRRSKLNSAGSPAANKQGSWQMATGCAPF